MRPSVSVKGAGNGAQGGGLGSRGRMASSSSPHGSQGLGCCSVDVSSVRPSVDICSVSGPVRMLAEEPLPFQSPALGPPGAQPGSTGTQ